MRYWKNIVSLLLSICICGCILPGMALCAGAEEMDYQWITARESVDGSDFTDNTVLAGVINEILDGKANVFYDAAFTRMVNTELGSSPVRNNGVNMYVGPVEAGETNVGTSCWIYANGVYYTLFGECTGSGSAGENSRKLDLKSTQNRNFTYENFVAWGVRPEPGALIRTQCGHSLIVLDYNEEGITILDGNGNGKGLVAIRAMAWNYQSFRAKYIIQPKQEYFDKLYSDAGSETGDRETESLITELYAQPRRIIPRGMT